MNCHHMVGLVGTGRYPRRVVRHWGPAIRGTVVGLHQEKRSSLDPGNVAAWLSSEAFAGPA